jgi:Ca2+-binding EF-hand superfamily protein
MKNNRFKTTVFLFAATLFFTSSSFGQERNKGDRKKPPTFDQLLEKMDANKDGKLSKEEIKGPLKNDFAKVDTNEDGFISKEEFEKAPRPKRGPKRK